ncbi:MAG: hypothetical protein IT304_02145 [Dehalococcoidia bacterium]|nr:hypothetical protein [Dehalococcoidia bacterium]
MGGARLGELAWSRRNIAASGTAREGVWSRRTYPLMVALHAGVIGVTAVRGSSRPRRLPLVALLAAQPLRLWVLATLGRRWNTRAVVAESTQVATGGPYRFVRHPNYTVVALELTALPLAFRLPGLALAAFLANALLLTLRVREEEALLDDLPGYRPHFTNLPRFVPRPGRSPRISSAALLPLTAPRPVSR